MKRSKHSQQLLWFAALVVSMVPQGGRSEESIPVFDARIPEFELDDQFGQSHRSTDFAHRHLIFVGGDRSASDEIQSWSVEIRRVLQARPDTQAELELVRVADLRGVPRSFEALVTKRMRKRQQVPVLMDWTGEITEVLRFERQHANVVLFDAAGTIRLSLQAGQPEAEEVEALREALDRLDLPSNTSSQLSDVAGLGSSPYQGEMR